MNDTLVRNSATEYTLVGPDVWITVGNLSVKVLRTEEGVGIDVWSLGGECEDPLGSLGILFADSSSCFQFGVPLPNKTQK